MTEIVFQKLEEKVLQVLADYEKSRVEADENRGEADQLRAELQRLNGEILTLRQEKEVLKQEKDALVQEKETTTRKVHELVAMFDTIGGVSTPTHNDNVVVSPTLLAVKPVLVQGQGG